MNGNGALALDTSASQGKAAAPSLAGRVTKIFVQILMLAGGIGIMYLPAVKDRLADIHEISEKLHALGWAAPGIFILAVAALVAIGVPRLLLCPIGGMAFGFFWGLIWTQIGTLLGYYGFFLLVHRAGKDFVLSKWPRLKRFTGISRRRGFITVLLIRQLPIAGFYINILLGLLPLTHLDFILGTAIGILPAAVPATLLGANAIHISSEKSIFYFMLAAAAFVIIWIASGRLLRAEALPEAEPLPGPAEK